MSADTDISAVQLRILKQARTHAMSHGLDEAVRLQYEIGLLYSEMRRQHDQLSQFTGAGAKPQSGCDFFDTTWGDVEIKLEYEYQAGEDAVWNLDSPMCGPGRASSVSIIQMLVNGCWIDVDGLVHTDLIDKWEVEIAESHEDSVRAAREADYEDHLDRQREMRKELAA